MPSGATMWIRIAIGVVFLVVGCVWIGQGVGWIHGSFMTGEAVWAVIGAGCVAIGVWLLAGVRPARRQRDP